MKGSSELYRLVYDYFSTRILFGFYACGDPLPSLPKVSTQFHMAIATVRKAFSLLERDGYIRVEASRAARVVYQTNTRQLREAVLDYFLPRAEGLKDLAAAGRLLIEPIWEFGLQRWDQETWDKLRRELLHPAPGVLFLPMELYLYVFLSLQNQLILNFYWEMLRYLSFPYLSETNGPVDAVFQDTEAPSNEALMQFLKQRHVDAYEMAAGKLFAFLEQPRGEAAAPEPIPFHWNIYRQRPQIRYSLASTVIREIMAETYPIGTYLPSLPQIAARYDVAISTVRRAVAVLTDLGVVRAYQGKGILVCMAPEAIMLSRPEVREVLAFYLESLQFLALTALPVASCTLQAASADALQTLAQRLCQSRYAKKSYLYLNIFLTFLIDQCPSAAVRECYRNLNELLACGYPVALLQISKSGLDSEYLSAVVRAEAHLQARDFAGLAGEWSRFLQQEEEQLRSFIQSEVGPM